METFWIAYRVKDDEPSTGFGAAQPFAILTNVILTTIFFAVFL